MVKLRIVEALQDDAYKGVARIDGTLMREMGLDRGDVIMIKGAREAYSIVDVAYPADMGVEMIRIDGITRRNAKAGIGDMIEVVRADIVPAKKITIAPVQKGIMVKADPDALKRGLLGKPVARGDILVLGGAQRRRDIMSEDMGDFFGDMLNQMGMGVPGNFSQLRFSVISVSPNTPCVVTENTVISVSQKAIDISEENIPEITYEDIGGLKEEVKKVRELVELPLKRPEIFSRLGIEPPKGVLLYGPPGTGKTLLARAVANESDANFIVINGPEIMSKFYGDSEKKIREIFDDAEKNAPSIIFIDEIDAVAPKREDSQGEVEKRVVSQLLTMMDGLQNRGKVVVIGATNRPNAVDPALRRPGRFDREVEISVPDKAGRLQILKIHTRNMPLVYPIEKTYLENEINNIKKEQEDLREILQKTMNVEYRKNIENDLNKTDEDINSLSSLIDKFSNNKKKNIELFNSFDKKDKEILSKIFMSGMVEELAGRTHGFVGADLESLAKEAAMVVLRKNIHNFNLEEDKEIPKEVLEKLVITSEDFNEGLKVVRPSAMREVFVETPDVSWDDVGGIETVQRELKEAVEWPLKFSHAFDRMGIRAPKGVLLYGPPGTGKTLLAKAIAYESEANFIQIKGPSLLSMWVGKSEEGIRKIFERARQVSPCIVFFDEIDSLASKRGVHTGGKVTDNVLNQLLSEMDGIEDLSNVIVIGATNRPDILDPALLRPGRFDRIVYVPVPEKEGREQVLRIHTKNMPIDGKEKIVSDLAGLTEGYTGADLESLAREAAMLALREDIKCEKVTMKHFNEALKKVLPSVSKEDEALYKEIEKKYLKSAGAGLGDALKSYLG